MTKKEYEVKVITWGSKESMIIFTNFNSFKKNCLNRKILFQKKCSLRRPLFLISVSDECQNCWVEAPRVILQLILLLMSFQFFIS